MEYLGVIAGEIDIGLYHALNVLQEVHPADA
jgi:hypothetical protein